MKKSILTVTLAALGLFAVATPPGKKGESLKVNAKESTAKWHAKKVTGEHFGTVQLSTGEILVDGNNLTGGFVNINMSSIDVTDLTGEWKDKLVGHLNSDDFFSTAKHNTAVLKIKKATPTGAKASEGKNNYTVVADLTVKGITKEITFPAMVVITKGKVIANADFNIDRTLFDIKYGSKSFFAEIGDKAIDNEFNVKVRIIAQN